MRYKVRHIEKYVLNDEIRIYGSISELKKKYIEPTLTYSEGVTREIEDLKVGESVFFDYDHYVRLEVTALND